MDYDDVSDSLSLGCQHRFCKGCWKEYLERKVKTEAESGRVQCMEAGCQRVVKEQVFQSLLDDSTASRYVGPYRRQAILTTQLPRLTERDIRQRLAEPEMVPSPVMCVRYRVPPGSTSTFEPDRANGHL
jgi:hypothetical protein